MRSLWWLFNEGWEIWEVKEIRDKIVGGEIKLLVCVDDLIIYIEDLRELIDKLLKLKKEFSVGVWA